MKYVRVLTAVCSSVWAIEPEKGRQIAQFLAFAAAGGVRSDEELQEIVGQTGREAPERASAPSSIAVIPLSGMIVPHEANAASLSEQRTSAAGFARAVREAVESRDVAAVVMNIDSPGGNVQGVPEAFADIYALRGEKPIVAVANHFAASAAYHIASAADEILASPSAEVGSIGVYTIHEDISKALEAEGVAPTIIQAGRRKTEGNPLGPLDAEAREFIQGRVNEFYDMFTRDVAQGRDVPVSDARGERFGEGRLLGAKAAKDAGVIDGIETLAQTINRLQAQAGSGSRPSARARRQRFAIA